MMVFCSLQHVKKHFSGHSSRYFHEDLMGATSHSHNKVNRNVILKKKVTMMKLKWTILIFYGIF